MQRITLRVVAPKTAVAAIIGKGGQQIKELQETTNAKIQVSNREEGLVERIITVSGHLEDVRAAAFAVAASLQRDLNLKSQMYVVYKNISPINGALSLCYGQPLGLAVPYPSLAIPQAQLQQQQQQQLQQQQQQQQELLMSQPCEIFLHVPEGVVGAVIGRNGKCVADIIKQSGARIQISQKGVYAPGTNNRKVTIAGGVAAVHRAHILLLQRVFAAHESAAAAAAAAAAATNGVLISTHPLSSHNNNNNISNGIDINSTHSPLQPPMPYVHPPNYGY